MGLTVFFLIAIGVSLLIIGKGLLNGSWAKVAPVNLIIVTNNHADVIEGIVRGLANLAASYGLEMQMVLMDRDSRDGTRVMNRLLAKEYSWVMTMETSKEVFPLQQAFYCELPTGVNSVEILQVFARLFALIKQQAQVRQLCQNQIYIKYIYTKKYPI